MATPFLSATPRSSLVRFSPSTARWPHTAIIAAERAAGRLNPYLGHLMVPIDPSTIARSLMRRSFPVGEDEALVNIREAVIGCLEIRAESGLPLTVRVVEIEVAVA